MATDSEVGRRLKEWRQAAGYSQEALAVLVNEELDGIGTTWRQSTTWKVETGSRPLSYVELMALSEIFNDDDWHKAPSDTPDSDRRSKRRHDALTAEAAVLRFEEQALLVRLAEIRAERRRVLDQLDAHPGDPYDDDEGRK